MSYLKEKNYKLIAGVQITPVSTKTGTWTLTASSDQLYSLVDPDATLAETMTIPLSSLMDADNGQGSSVKINSIDLYFTVGTAALSANVAELHKVSLADGSFTDATIALTGTLDTAAGSHKATLTPSTTAEFESTDMINLEWKPSLATTGTCALYGIGVNYDSK